MPDKQFAGQFEVDPNFDMAAYIEKRIEETRCEFERQLSIVDGLNDDSLQLICMFSMIDCMAQEWDNYSERKQSDIFCDFVLSHQTSFDYLDAVEPITLYYRVEDLIEKQSPFSGMPEERIISLESLVYLDLRFTKDVVKTNKADEILEYLRKTHGTQYADKKAKEHRLVALLYRMRSKATHEMTGLGSEIKFHKRENYTEPYYRDIGRTYVENEHIVRDDVCELVIPNAFIKTILTDCINSYLSECREEKRDPFSNNRMTRKHILSWYDK